MKTSGGFIVERQHEFPYATGELTALLSVIKLGAKIIRRDINKVGLVNTLGTNDVKNVQGEVQQKPDLFANEELKVALKIRDIVVGIASEEKDEIVVFEGCEHVRYVVLMDPLDGSSNVDVSASVSTVFSIYHRITPVGIPVTGENFLQPGNKQVVAGYVIYGSFTILMYTTGCGVHTFTYDPSLDVLCLSQERMRFPVRGSMHFINGGNYIRFPNNVRKYARFCQEEDRPTQCSYTSHYIGPLVMDLHRNLLEGGIYLYPSTASRPQGKLRLLYECNLMTFLAEQTGDEASDGKERALSITPKSLYQHRPFFVGNDRMVEGVERFIHEFSDAQASSIART